MPDHHDRDVHRPRRSTADALCPPPSRCPRARRRSCCKGQKALVTGANSGIGRGVASRSAEAGADVVVNYSLRRGQGRASVVDEIDAVRRARDRRQGRRVGRGRRCSAMFARDVRRVRHDRHPRQQRRACSRTRRSSEMTLAAVEHGHRRQPDRPVPLLPRGGARVQAPRRAQGRLLRRRQDHLHELGARGDSVGRARELRGVEGRRDADDEEHRAGSRAVPHPRQQHLPRARSARRSTCEAWDTPEAYDELLKLIPYKRIGEPEDIGRAAVWLASDYADYVHGIEPVRRRRHDAVSRLRDRRLKKG